MSFSDKVVIVTGASSGIGASTAELFAKQGASVVLVARNQDKLSDVAARCKRDGKTPLVVKADISIDEEARSIIEKTVNAHGKIDVLVNNAGIIKPASILHGNIMESYDAVMATNLRAVIHLTSLAAPYLIKTKGNVVNVSSTLSRTIVSPDYITYCVSKAGLDHFTHGAALELAPAGVRVNAVNPGPTKTDILEKGGYGSDRWDDAKANTALDRISEPEEIGDLILFLASSKAKGITGSIYVSDNGMLLKC